MSENADSGPTPLTGDASIAIEMCDVTLTGAFHHDGDRPELATAPRIPVIVRLIGHDHPSSSGVIVQIDNLQRDPNQPVLAELVIENYGGSPRLHIGIGAESGDVDNFAIDLGTGNVIHHRPYRP